MTFRILLLLCFIFCWPQNSSSQENLAQQNDTLQTIIEKSNKAYDRYDYKNVIKHGASLIERGKRLNDDHATFLGYDMLGGVYSEIGDTVRGRMYSEKALEIARNAQADSLISWGTLNLAIFYSERPQTYQKAVGLFEESIAINKEYQQHSQLLLTYINLSWTHLDHGNPEMAYTVLKKALSLSSTLEGNTLNKHYVEMLLGRYYLATKKYSPAISRLKSVAKEADRDSIVDLALEAYEHLTLGYQGIQDYKNAYNSLTKYNRYKQKSFTEEKIEEAEKAKAKFNLQETQKDLNAALREKQYSERLIAKSKTLNTIFILATVILLIALLGFYLLFKSRKKYIGRLKTRNKELKTAKEKAEKLSKVKTRFLSTVSHELRTPLYGVIGISTLLREDEDLKAYEDDLKSLKFSADYLLALVNDVLLLSKMDAEAITLSQQPYKLGTLIQNIVRSFEFILQKNNNTLHLQIHEDLPNALIGDSMRLSQILINLIGNAAKFNQNGNIWLTLDLVKMTKKNLYRTRFTIKDDGPGIPLDKQKVIFEEFSQIEQTNHDYKGSGLGLTIVKKLLKLYKSDIHLKSEPGEGSEFSFVLNLKEDTVNPGKSPKKSTVPNLDDSFRERNLHVLVVDDNRINQKITQKILERHHIASSLANDGQQAVNMHKSQKFDMILMDINMPKINGMQAAKMIRDIDEKTPIIALTAVELDEIRDKILDSGISDIIHKPYEIHEFLKMVRDNLPSETVDIHK
ncbi:response regulator [Pricia sp. S334]|uniref:histidine kinase n=1 Tax=Pricia mediterranea TaxID=3076079 RepID=A0ABU3L965_9FLAO|nr:ATP-binding protein [Pricia sp. S334]MDT7830269.1 response regulator [Pricia sp. S334]